MVFVEVTMFLFVDFLMSSILYCCSSEYPGIPAEQIDHGKFSFSAPAVRFLETNNLGVPYMNRVEKIIRANQGVASIQYDGNFYVSVSGIKNGERHLGCFSTDDKCRIIGFLEMPK